MPTNYDFTFSISDLYKMTFCSQLMHWYKYNKRPLPWRENKDPYKIWISEIMLQQTRVAQATEFYYRFMDRFPTIHALARAPEDEVLALWQGLGYYSRARNILFTAQTIEANHGGNFPTSYKDIIQLKGIGPYTAAAIASIVFGQKIPAIDGNLNRVMARYLCIEEPVDKKEIQNTIRDTLTNFMQCADPGEFNQALMDLGSSVCKPGKPSCDICPFFESCLSRKKGLEAKLPLKKTKTPVKERFFHFFHLQLEDGFFVEKREKNDIWKNLYQLPLIETLSPDLRQQDLETHLWAKDIVLTEINLNTYLTHKLTHRLIHAYFYKIAVLPSSYPIFAGHFLKVSMEQFHTMGKPVLIQKFLIN